MQIAYAHNDEVPNASYEFDGSTPEENDGNLGMVSLRATVSRSALAMSKLKNCVATHA